MVPLDLSPLPTILDGFRAEGVEAIAICFINSYADASHEIAAAGKIKELWPEIAVVASHQISREWREYERTNTAVLSAYVKPVACHYLDRLTGRLENGGMKSKPYIMQSNCGVDTVTGAREIPITMVESGPASGVWGAAALGVIIGELNVIALDIGGTTAKCSLIADGQIQINTNYMIEQNATSAGYPIMVPVVDLVEIGNGGGSIAWVDEFGKLHVGPQSAGTLPGPVAYGKGGTEATTTDANLALGRINPDYFCGGSLTADMVGVNKSLELLAKELGVDSQEAARGIVRIANNNMVNALKLVSVNRGHDPRDFTMIAFGGGGAMHGCSLAAELGIKKVVIPKQSAVFSAWGMLMCDLRRDFIQTRIVELTGDEAAVTLSATWRDLEEKALEEFSEEGVETGEVELVRYGRFRYQNQEHSVEVRMDSGEIKANMIDQICSAFHENYEHEYTYRLDAPVELVSYHLVATAQVGKIEPESLPVTGRLLDDALKGNRLVDFAEEGFHQAAIYDGNLLEPEMKFIGPAVIEESGTTVVILPAMSGEVDKFGNIHIITTREEVRS